MRILALLNSNVHGGRAEIPKNELFPEAMQAPLGRAIGEPVETIARACWPTHALPAAVDRWMQEARPELVLFSVGAFWFLYESTPVRMERRLRGPGQLINRASQKVAATPWLAHNRPFQWGRRQAQRAVGGDAWFEPEHVTRISKDVIRVVQRYESSYLAVLGPSGGERWASSAADLERLLARRARVSDSVGNFCADLGVEYWDAARMAALRDPRPASRQGDDLHMDREGHRRAAEHYLEWGVGLVTRAREHSRARVGPGG